MNKICKICTKEYSRKKKSTYKEFEKSSFCSRECKYKDRAIKMRGNDFAKGKEKPKEWKEFMSNFMQGNSFGFQKGHRMHWRGGVTNEYKKIRSSGEYRLWRISVFKRDKYTCQECGQIGGNLNADHIKPFALYPEHRLNINNGRTLCKECHLKTDTYGSRTKKLLLTFTG